MHSTRKSIALNKVRRFNSVALKRAKSQRCFGVVLMWMDLLRWEHDTLSFHIYINIYTFKNMKDFSLLHCDLKMLVSESTRLPVLPLCALPNVRVVCLVICPPSWEFGSLPFTSKSSVLVSVCGCRRERLNCRGPPRTWLQTECGAVAGLCAVPWLYQCSDC